VPDLVGDLDERLGAQAAVEVLVEDDLGGGAEGVVGEWRG
jgi:hypothetical protein